MDKKLLGPLLLVLLLVGVGILLSYDPAPQKIAAEYGLRIQDTTVFQRVQKAQGLTAPSAILAIVDPPAYEWLERMIKATEAHAK